MGRKIRKSIQKPGEGKESIDFSPGFFYNMQDDMFAAQRCHHRLPEMIWEERETMKQLKPITNKLLWIFAIG